MLLEACFSVQYLENFLTFVINSVFREEPFYDIQLNVKGKKDSEYCSSLLIIFFDKINFRG